MCEELAPAQVTPDGKGIFQSICRGVFFEHLVEGERGKEEDGIDVVEIGYPRCTRGARAADIGDEELCALVFAAFCNNVVFFDADGTYTGPNDVV